MKFLAKSRTQSSEFKTVSISRSIVLEIFNFKSLDKHRDLFKSFNSSKFFKTVDTFEDFPEVSKFSIKVALQNRISSSFVPSRKVPWKFVRIMDEHFMEVNIGSSLSRTNFARNILTC